MQASLLVASSAMAAFACAAAASPAGGSNSATTTACAKRRVHGRKTCCSVRLHVLRCLLHGCCKLRHRHVRLERSEWLRAVRTSSRPVTLDMRPRECGDASGAAVEEGGCLAVTALAAVPQSARCTNLSLAWTAILPAREEKGAEGGQIRRTWSGVQAVCRVLRTHAMKLHFLDG